MAESMVIIPLDTLVIPKRTKSKPIATSLNTSELLALLRERYPKDAYAFMCEVPNGTGGYRSRTADALVMSLWPSRGLDLYGFEVKASRQDWLNELKKPEKADAICRYCDYWYLVVGNEAIVQAGELPPTWGLIVPANGKLKVKIEAPKLEAQPVTRPFLAALFRAAQDNLMPDAQLAAIKREAEKKGSKEAEKHYQWQIDDYKKKIEKFREETGVSFDNWNFATIREAIAIVKEGNVEALNTRLRTIKDTAQRIIEMVDRTQKANVPE